MNYLNVNQYKCASCGNVTVYGDDKCDNCLSDNWVHPIVLNYNGGIVEFSKDAKSLGYTPMSLLECWNLSIVKEYKKYLTKKITWEEVQPLTRKEYELFLTEFRNGGVTLIDETLARAIALINALDGERQRNSDNPMLKYINVDKL